MGSICSHEALYIYIYMSRECHSGAVCTIKVLYTMRELFARVRTRVSTEFPIWNSSNFPWLFKHLNGKIQALPQIDFMVPVFNSDQILTISLIETLYRNLSFGGTRIFQGNLVNNIDADVMSPWAARLSATTVKHIIVFHEGWFQLPAPSQIERNCNIFLIFQQ